MNMKTGWDYFQWAMGNIEKRLAFIQKWNHFDQPNLARHMKRLLNHYGVRTGYLPPDFKLTAQDAHRVFSAKLNADIARTKAASTPEA